MLGVRGTRNALGNDTHDPFTSRSPESPDKRRICCPGPTAARTNIVQDREFASPGVSVPPGTLHARLGAYQPSAPRRLSVTDILRGGGLFHDSVSYVWNGRRRTFRSVGTCCCARCVSWHSVCHLRIRFRLSLLLRTFSRGARGALRRLGTRFWCWCCLELGIYFGSWVWTRLEDFRTFAQDSVIYDLQVLSDGMNLPLAIALLLSTT